MTEFPQDKVAEPVRLRVNYNSAEGLISEFTRSVGKGAVTLETRKSLAVGTRFVFDMRAGDDGPSIEVCGEVVDCCPTPDGRHELTIRYDPGDGMAGLKEALHRVFEDQRQEKIRSSPRVPIQIQAAESRPHSPSFVIRDLSQGGMGLEVEDGELPPEVKIGAPFLCEIHLSTAVLCLHGEVAWCFSPPASRRKWMDPSFGVLFGKLRPDTLERLKQVLTLKGLPPPPWTARVNFGLEAISRMP